MFLSSVLGRLKYNANSGLLEWSASKFPDAWHVHSQLKVWFDQNFSTLRCNKNLFKKSSILKMSTVLIFNNNNSGKLLTNWGKIKTPMNN